ncbi:MULTISPECIES: glycoside hydrolase family 38 C-terminal domain-containing protein [Actinomyces]|uniref:Glycoside hydrolase family 38 central domain-containing protein n=1 Tax=Actinomyces respiraculi TaxID=2744574 RepID=A0A7T0LK44_9ACTO|nr:MULTISPECIES: glycoside hydrolase family 38 C-terminal domain-containing protein [Actinomyces]QPL05236.1 hypothetical protein ID810_11050 [Actinomyces respiraculi]
MSATRGDSPTAMWIVPHTHWDREWYEPHDVFRARLVRMIDGLLNLLEHEEAYRFTLDGQAAAFEDYLVLRPQNRERLSAAVARGQLAVGPFLILLDEFCCDGETTVRNLELGIRACRTLGGEMRVGYLPDMFGHAAQMPQILRGFGLADAALWRGVPAAVDRDAFCWRALDGSQVRVEYLWDGYGSALTLFDSPGKLDRLVADYLHTNTGRFDGRSPAGMYGTDHMEPRPDLLDAVRAHNARCPDAVMTVATLGQVVASREHDPQALDDLPLVVGEMRSHALGNILPGVLSARTNLKKAMAGAERALTTAERLDVAVGGPSRTALLERGWRLVVESSAHDSVTGCGADTTAEQVLTRLHVAAHAAAGAVDVALPTLARVGGPGELVAFNQSGWARRVQGETVLDGRPEALPEGAQLLEELPTVIGDETIPAEHVRRVLRRIHGQELFGGRIRGWSFPAPTELVFEVARSGGDAFDPDDFTVELDRRLAAAPDDRPWRVLTVAQPSCRVLVAGHAQGTAAVALGSDAGGIDHPVRVGERSMSNDLVRVDIDDDGLVSIEDLLNGRVIRRALAIVDEGDRGDSYNFGPVAGDRVDAAVATRVEVQERGPLRGRILVRRIYRLPQGLSTDRSTRSGPTQDQVIDTRIELREGERFVRVRTFLVNGVGNHRLRLHVPTFDRDLEGSVSAGQYGVTRRGRTSEDGWGEYPLPTYPATRFVHAGGVAVHTDRLTEYEIVTPPDGGAVRGTGADGEDGTQRPDEIAITLVRAVDLMSVNVHPLRDEPAGAQIPVPGAQYLGVRVETDLAVDLSCPRWDDSQIVRHSDLFHYEPVLVPGAVQTDAEVVESGGGTGEAEPVGSVVTTCGRVALESLRRVNDGVVEARFVNYHHHAEPLRARMWGRWDRTDLSGDVLEAGVDPWSLTVPASSIITLRSTAVAGAVDVEE